MADNRTSIILTAEDRASSTLAKVGSGLDRLSGSAAGLSSLKNALGGLGAAFSAGALISFAKSTIDAADNINDLSQKVGISIRDLVTWQLAAEQSGASLESVASGVKGLAKNMVDNGDAFKAAGITATDANGAMVQLADIFKAMPDGIEKTTLAVTLFGKSGMDMIPMLNQGSKGMADAQAKAAAYADKLAELAPKADEFNDKLTELGINAKAAAINVLLPLISDLTKLASGFVNVTRDGETFRKKMAEIADVTMSPAAAALGMPVNIFKRLTGGRNKSGVVGGKPGTTGWDLRADAAGALALPGGNSEAEKLATARGMALNKALGGGTKKSGKAGSEFDALDASLDMAQQADAEWKKIIKDKEKAAAANETLVEQYRNMADPLRKYFKQLEEINALQGVSDTEKQDFARRVIENMDEEIAKLNELGVATQETNEFARDMGMTFASAFEDAIVEGKSFSEVLQGLAKDINRIVVRKTITEPLGNAISGAIGNSGIGDGVGAFLKNMLPSYAVGTPYVPTDGLAYLHKGEAVVPAAYNVPGQGGQAAAPVNINFSVSAMDAGSFRSSMAANRNVIVGIVREAFTRRAITSPV